MTASKLGAMILQKSRLVTIAMVFACVLPVLAQSTPKPKVTQAQVARKGSFPSVDASETVVRAATLATNLTSASAKLNKTASFVGTVTMVYVPNSGKRVLLNFAPNYKKALVGLVDAKNFKAFPDLRQLKDKRVLLTGKVIKYKDQTEVELASLSAIRLVK